METMQDRLAAAVMAGLVLFGAGCSASTALSGGGHTSSAAVSSALPSPFTISARYSAASLGLSHPASLAIGPDGNLYVTDLSQRVTVISPAGTVLRRWGKPGTGPGQFRFIPGDPAVPTDVFGKIAVGPGALVYVADSGNARVQVFTPQGRFIRQIGSYGSRTGQFLFSGDIAVDNAGNVYVADAQSDTLAKFSPAGQVAWTIGGNAAADQDLTGCCFNFTGFDAHGRLVIVNDSQNRVLYVDQGGHKVDAFTHPMPRLSPSASCARPPLTPRGTRICRAAARSPPGLRWSMTGRIG